MVSTDERFWKKVLMRGLNECWEWVASKNEKGYGYFKLDGKMQKAHREAWQMVFGEIPSNTCVCHSCDNPSCCNPSHLWLGDNSDNVSDRENKRRGIHRFLPGEDNISSKITRAIAENIRIEYANGKTQVSLAKEYGIHQTTVSKIILHKKWA